MMLRRVTKIFPEGGFLHFEYDVWESAEALARGDEPILRDTWANNYHLRVNVQRMAPNIRHDFDAEISEIQRDDTGEWATFAEWHSEGGLIEQGVPMRRSLVTLRTEAQWHAKVQGGIDALVGRVMRRRGAGHRASMAMDQRSPLSGRRADEEELLPVFAASFARERPVGGIVARAPEGRQLRG
jgi:hypothetical protein